MSKQEEAELILKLYDLRREAVMRQARQWFVMEFNPQSIDDVKAAMFSEHSGHLRMVMSYWEMAAALVNDGAISRELFDRTNGEHLVVFSKLEPLVKDMRAAFGERSLENLEKLIEATPGARERVAQMRERMQAVRAELARRQKQTTAQG